MSETLLMYWTCASNMLSSSWSMELLHTTSPLMKQAKAFGRGVPLGEPLAVYMGNLDGTAMYPLLCLCRLGFHITA